jgi:hypothetical protein
MNPKALDYVPGQDWIAVVGKNGTSEFATAFVAQPVLHASVLNAPCIGVEPIAAFFAVTSGMYDRLAFTHETKDSSKICLEWEGKVFGEDVAGTTILTRNDAGLGRGRGLPLLLVAGLIHDIPTCKELIDRIMAEAEAIIRSRLEGLLAA